MTPNLEQVSCPNCDAVSLTLEQKLQVRPLGSFSLSGHQMKASANWVWVIQCGNCTTEWIGEEMSNQPEGQA